VRVKDCEGCKHNQRRTWSQYHKPKNFHAVGFSHAYAYCTKHQQRVSAVKKCSEMEVGK
jgi:hypothetical protein